MKFLNGIISTSKIASEITSHTTLDSLETIEVEWTHLFFL